MRCAPWLGIVAIAFVACRAKVGDTCAKGDVTCDDDRAGALACVEGHLARVACGGRAACSTGTRASCDQTIARMGDACVGGEACAVDAVELLRCDGGRFVSAGRCGGPAGCVVERGAIACDTSRGEAGDPCRDRDEVTCARDAKSALACTAGRLTTRTTCRGPRGCAIDDARKLRCDDSIAEPDDACDLDGQAACSSDGTAELRCVAGKFARVRVCRRPPCKATASEILCD
jgi:hypothetical protein